MSVKPTFLNTGNLNIKRLLCFYLLVITEISFGQDLPIIVPPSPDIAALMRYAEIPISHSTGVPNIEVNLYTANSGQLQLPIKLTYHASGNKVQDIASVAGLGWILQAGGAISCSVLGVSDAEEPYSNPFKSSSNTQSMISQAITNGNGLSIKNQLDRMYYYNDYETQSDRYMYNFNGYSGVFRYDLLTGAQHKIPYRPIDIKSVPGKAAPSGEIIVEDGTKYYFDYHEGVGAGSQSYSQLLTKMVSADNTDQIELFYKSTTDNLFQFIPSFRLTMGDDYTFEIDDPNLPFPTIDTRAHFTTQFFNNSYIQSRNKTVLDYILTNEAKIVFEYLTDRVDVVKTRLTKIKVYDRYTNEKIREISLDQSYFGSQADNNRRLRLDAVNISGKVGSAVEKTSFIYNTTPLPPYYNSAINTMRFKEDYWGYYNGSDSPTLIPAEFLPDIYTQSVYGANLNPHPDFAQAAIIQEIKYPTGGRTVFEFESNRGGTYSYSSNDIMGGLRIKKMRTYADNSSTPIIKSYDYLTIGAAPYIDADFFHYQWYIDFYFYHSYVGLLRPRAAQDVYTSNSYATLQPGNSISVYYSLVRENIGDNEQGIISYTTYEYDIPPFNYNPSQIGGHPRFMAENHFDRGTFEPKLLNQTQFRKINNTFQFVKSIENTYTTFRANEFLTGFKIDRTDMHVVKGGTSPDLIPIITYLNGYFTSDTKGYEDISMLTKTQVIDDSDPNNRMTLVTNYNYSNTDHLQLTSKELITSKGYKLITSYKYPHDFNGTQPYTDMVGGKHIWSPIIEQNEYKNTTGDLLQSTRTSYADWGAGIIAPQTISIKNRGETNYEDRIQFYGYDAHANVLSVSKDKGPMISYLWGYNGQYPVAEAKNASTHEIFYESFESNGTTGSAHTGTKYFNGDYTVNWTRPNTREYTITCWYRVNNVWIYAAGDYTGPVTLNAGDAIDDVKIYPKDAHMTTFTYTPLVGLTSITDAKEKVSYFEYDDYQRLTNIKDQNGNFVKSMDYHYKPL